MTIRMTLDMRSLRDIAAYADEEEGIRQGLEDLKNGKVRLAREFLAEFEAKNGIAKQVRGHLPGRIRH
ncbi:MAG: hypothetical protein QOG55_293 [Acidobacteriaceae bacterium]|nr:hypothetical protein [Acidobacteriaceae bacterium]